MAILIEPIVLVVSAGLPGSVLAFRPAAQEEIGVVEMQVTILRPRPEMLDVEGLKSGQRERSRPSPSAPCSFVTTTNRSTPFPSARSGTSPTSRATG